MQLGEEAAVVVSISEAGGVVDIELRFDADGRMERASLRTDSMPAGLAEGSRVGVTKAALYRRWQIRLRDA